MQIGGVNQSHSQVFLSDVWYCQLFPLDHSDILSDLFPATRSSLGMALPRLQPLYTQIEQNIYPVQFFENSPRLIPFSDSSRTHLWFLILYLFQTLGFFTKPIILTSRRTFLVIMNFVPHPLSFWAFVVQNIPNTFYTHSRFMRHIPHMSTSARIVTQDAFMTFALPFTCDEASHLEQ